jgi:N-acyl homoserine lactone hydrolase
VIVVDTGEDARASQRSYFARWHPGIRAFREWVEPDQEIGPQLERLGIRPGDVRCVVMTHLHTDHAGGLRHFPDNEILVTRSELEFASGLGGRVRGYVANKHWPAWFNPTVIELDPEPFGPFPQSLRLTEAGDVTLVPVPGHTRGQIGLLVDEGDHNVFLAGDSSYTQDLLLRGESRRRRGG